MQITTEIITPEFAERVLRENNPTNRRLDRIHTAFLAQEMASGTFAAHNGDAIRFDESGNLLDGQHRLAAIVKCGLSLMMTVARGISRDTFATIDIGKRRNISDVVGIDLAANGMSAPRGAVSAASLLHNYECRFERSTTSAVNGNRRTAPPMSVIRDICVRPGFAEVTVRASSMARRLNTTTIAPVTVALIACGMDNKEAADDYFHRLLSTAGEARGIPEITVTKTLGQWKLGGSTVHRSAYGHLYALLRGYVARRDGESLNLIRVPKTPDGFIYLPTA